MNISKISSSYTNHYRGLSFPIWLELFAGAINAGVSVTVLFVAIYLTNQIGISSIETGWAIASFGFGAMLGSLMGGWLSDKFEMKYITTITMVLSGIALFVFPYMHNFYYISFVIMCLGITNNAFLPANRTALMNMAPKDGLHKVSNMRYMLMNMGVGAYIFIDGRIASFGFERLFQFNSAIILMTSLISIYIHFFYQKPPNVDSVVSKEEQGEIKLASAVNIKRVLLVYYVSLLFTAFIFSQTRATYPLFLNTHYHVDEQLLSNLFLINTIIIVLFQIPLLNYLNSFNSIITSGIGGLLIGLGMGLLFLSSNYWVACLLCAIWTLGEILYFSTLQVIIFDRAHKKRKGTHMGVYQFIIAFSNMIGPAFGSFLYSYSSNLLWGLCLTLGISIFLLHMQASLRNKTY